MNIAKTLKMKKLKYLQESDSILKNFLLTFKNRDENLANKFQNPEISTKNDINGNVN